MGLKQCDHSQLTEGRPALLSSEGHATSPARMPCAPTIQTKTCARQCGDLIARTDLNQLPIRASGKYLRQKNMDELKSPDASHQHQTRFGLLFERCRIRPMEISDPSQHDSFIKQRPSVSSVSSRKVL